MAGPKQTRTPSSFGTKKGRRTVPPLLRMNGSCGIPACIATSVKLFVFLFVCGVSLSAGSLIDTMSLSAGSLIDTMTELESSAIPSTNASTNVTEDQGFSIKFVTKPCEEKQKEIIERVASYFKTCKTRENINTTAVQPGSDSQNDSGWCLNVFVRAAESFKKETAKKAMYRIMKGEGDCSIYLSTCNSSQSHVLDQSVGQDPSVESKNLPGETTFAAALASGTNSGKQDSGDQ